MIEQHAKLLQVYGDRLDRIEKELKIIKIKKDKI